MERLSCPAAQLKGDTKVVQMLFNTGSNRVADYKKGSVYSTSLKPYVQKTEDVLTSNLLDDKTAIKLISLSLFSFFPPGS